MNWIRKVAEKLQTEAQKHFEVESASPTWLKEAKEQFTDNFLESLKEPDIFEERTIPYELDSDRIKFK